MSCVSDVCVFQTTSSGRQWSARLRWKKPGLAMNSMNVAAALRMSVCLLKWMYALMDISSVVSALLALQRLPLGKVRHTHTHPHTTTTHSHIHHTYTHTHHHHHRLCTYTPHTPPPPPIHTTHTHTPPPPPPPPPMHIYTTHTLLHTNRHTKRVFCSHTCAVALTGTQAHVCVRSVQFCIVQSKGSVPSTQV